MAERKAVIKNADMSEDMQQDAVDCASQVGGLAGGWCIGAGVALWSAVAGLGLAYGLGTR